MSYCIIYFHSIKIMSSAYLNDKNTKIISNLSAKKKKNQTSIKTFNVIHR